MPEYEQWSTIVSEVQVRHFTAHLNSRIAAPKSDT